MLRLPRKPIVWALAVVTSLALAACGKSHTAVSEGDNTGAGGVNAVYLHLGNLLYQVEVSRQLNPADPEDKGYLAAVPARQGLAPGQVWFGVFLLVQNNSKRAGVATNVFTLTDTQGDVYYPLTLGADNPYAYRPQTVAPNNQLPPLGTTAAYGPTQASLVLFKVPISAYDNRPLVLAIGNPDVKGLGVKVTLDV
jgi:hypothetical protein